MVYEDEDVLAFRDINPQAPVHILLIPRKHISTLTELKYEDSPVTAKIFRVAAKLAGQENIARSGFRVVANCNADAGQAVFHIHFHLLGGRRMKWPPG